jgi:mRNA-degrading endonuclease toxin of MazEF toxin-antitoxin module
MTDFKKHQFDASFFCIIVPFTTKIREPLLPSHALTAADSGSLRYDSVALCEQIRAIDKGSSQSLVTWINLEMR